jgi:hypothetical protein
MAAVMNKGGGKRKQLQMNSQYLTLVEITTHLAQTEVAVGLAGEIAVAHAFEANGYEAEIEHERGDLRVTDERGQIHRVEVKTARRGTDGRWRFNLYKKGSQDHRGADYVVLLALAKTGHGVPFVLPIAACRDKHHISIATWPLFYRGQWSPYRQSMRKLRLPEDDARWS